MGTPTPPQPVRLVMGLIVRSLELIEDTKSRLESNFGKVDITSETIRFTHTSYYTPEMGSPLWRLWFSHEPLISPGDVVRVKLATNEMEATLSVNGRRQVNLDPGYLSLSKFVLVTTKDAAHRIYLGEGIYGELTLSYSHNSWTPLPWTYPDHREREALEFFGEVRKSYHAQLVEAS
jgi:hypothetical protein